jgi:hypothetical protein
VTAGAVITDYTTSTEAEATDSYTAHGSISNLTITATSIGAVTASAALGYTASISNVTITASNGSIGGISAVSGISGNMTASGDISSVSTATGDIAGTFTATNGNISAISVSNGSLLANLSAGGSIGTLYALNNITGTIQAGGDVGASNITLANGTYKGLLAATGKIQGNITSNGGMIGGVAALNGSILGNITASNGSIGNVYAFNGDISGTISAAQAIGTVFATGNITNTISSAGSINFISANGNISSTVTSGQGALIIFSGVDISGNVTTHGTITALAVNSITGKLIVNGQGQIFARAGLNITSGDSASYGISAPGDVFVSANGNITAKVISINGGLTELAGGTIPALDTGIEDPNAIDSTTYNSSLQSKVIADHLQTIAQATIPSMVCFAAGTLVLLADGSVKKIEDIGAGELVLATPEKKPETHPEARSVLEVFHNRVSRLYEVRLADDVIKVTATHPFYVKSRGWIPAHALCSNDELRTHQDAWVAVHSVTDSGIDEPVFNLHIDEAHTYFVFLPKLEVAVLVHNDSGSDYDSPWSWSKWDLIPPVALVHAIYSGGYHVVGGAVIGTTNLYLSVSDVARYRQGMLDTATSDLNNRLFQQHIDNLQGAANKKMVDVMTSYQHVMSSVPGTSITGPVFQPESAGGTLGAEINGGVRTIENTTVTGLAEGAGLASQQYRDSIGEIVEWDVAPGYLQDTERTCVPSALDTILPNATTKLTTMYRIANSSSGYSLQQARNFIVENGIAEAATWSKTISIDAVETAAKAGSKMVLTVANGEGGSHAIAIEGWQNGMFEIADPLIGRYLQTAANLARRISAVPSVAIGIITIPR